MDTILSRVRYDVLILLTCACFVCFIPVGKAYAANDFYADGGAGSYTWVADNNNVSGLDISDKFTATTTSTFSTISVRLARNGTPEQTDITPVIYTGSVGGTLVATCSTVNVASLTNMVLTDVAPFVDFDCGGAPMTSGVEYFVFLFTVTRWSHVDTDTLFIGGGASGDNPLSNLCYEIGCYGSIGAGIIVNSPSAIPVDSSTRIISTIPLNGATISTSSTASLGAVGYVNSNDFVSGMYVQIKYAPYSASQASVANPDALFTVLTLPLTSAGPFYVATSSPVITVGLYTMQTQILTGSWLNGVLNFFGFGQFATNEILTATSTRFTADHLSSFYTFVASTTQSINDYLASSTISMASCTGFTSFDLLGCLNLLFVPQTEPIVGALENFKNGFLQYAPWGYLTRFVVILSGSSTSTLPSFSTTIPLGSADDLDTFTFDMQDMIAGGGSLLNSIPARGTSLTVQDVLQPLIRLFIALFVIIIIVRDLSGIAGRGRHNMGHSRE